MKAGKLRHIIIIEVNTPTRDEYGGLVDVWTTHKKVWADVGPMSGNEVMRSDQITAKISHKIIIRYLGTVTAQMRVNFNSRYFNIKNVLHRSERGDMTTLLCEELPDANRS
ncbi:MAG: phage head closure protein [Gammaproteobacteria bacterium]|nr:phage head closure protein [Gammaproteobacteria bacterium]